MYIDSLKAKLDFICPEQCIQINLVPTLRCGRLEILTEQLDHLVHIVYQQCQLQKLHALSHIWVNPDNH